MFRHIGTCTSPSKTRTAAAKKAVELGAKVSGAPVRCLRRRTNGCRARSNGCDFQRLAGAQKRPGIGIVNEPGALCWADLNTPNRQRAVEFYSALFGWTITAGEGKDPNGYLHIMNGEKFIGGIPPALQGPPHWLIYFYVSDVDASTAKAKEMGANTFLPPTSMEGVGRLTVLADPQGAVFAMFKEAPRN